MAASPGELLPALRQDLQLSGGAPNRHGGATHVIYDPLRHRYFSLADDQVLLLSRWRAVTREEFCRDASIALARDVSPRELETLLFFLHANNLTDGADGYGSQELATRETASRRSVWSRMVHSYLFVRIPLVRPHGFLQGTLPLVAPLFSKWAWGLVAFLGTVGLYLTSRQWDAFTTTFLHFLSLEGIAAYGVALVLIKVVHELGHAYTATRYGVRVTTMGIAFMVMMPLLYSDVTNAWRLRSHRERVNIDAAGIVVELGLACIATCLWAFLPDGSARSVAFVAATTSWVLSLAINLNPFMKFDGYYLLVDALGIPNLQDRSFALARWNLREILFGIGLPPPDQFSSRMARMLIVYAWCVWIYRVFLFLGIALLVYFLFFKVLGVLLFVIEIGWFVVLPILRELKNWWMLRRAIMSKKRILVTGSVLVTVLVICFSPMRWSVTVPAILEAANDVAVHSPREARIVSVSMRPGLQVRQGDELAVLASPELRHALQKNALAIALLDLRLSRLAGDHRELALRTTITQERLARLEERTGIERQLDELVLRAPASGLLKDMDKQLHRGTWVNREHLLARVVRRDRAVVRAYANEDQLWHFQLMERGEFLADDPQFPSVSVLLTDISDAGADELSIKYLSSVFGGSVAGERDGEGRVIPRRSQYVLRFQASDASPTSVIRGVVRLPGRAQSIASVVWRQVLRVLVRESGI